MSLGLYSEKAWTYHVVYADYRLVERCCYGLPCIGADAETAAHTYIERSVKVATLVVSSAPGPLVKAMPSSSDSLTPDSESARRIADG